MPPKPEISKIQPIAGPELDRTTEMSNSAARPGETPVLTQAEWERLYRAIDKPRDRAIFQLAYHAGLRASEVGLLEMRDYQPRATVNAMDRIYVHRLQGLVLRRSPLGAREG